ncbi:MAG TPA: choice-of-anchor Q domain-containing protein [Ardenticatenaceae bacterium]|nr:choice-of-anchor Q domain-containing protein [Ardenticatenaceae bacterium]
MRHSLSATRWAIVTRFAWLAVLLAGLALLVVGAQAAQTATIGVTTMADELNADGDCSLREAIRAANLDSAVDACPAGSNLDTVSLPGGTYTVTIAGAEEDEALTGDLDISEGLILAGAGSDRTVLDGGGLDRLFDIRVAAPVQISGLTMRNGLVEGNGGAIRGSGPLTLTNVIVHNSRAALRTGETPDASGNGNGGGVYNSGTTPSVAAPLTVTNSSFRDNVADSFGGAIAANTVSAVAIANSAIAGNRATGAGGLMHQVGPTTLSGSTVDANVATAADGGGVFNAGGPLTITTSAITRNQAGDHGGGVYNDGGAAAISQATIQDNQAGAYGGGISDGNGRLRLTYSTISGNTAGQEGGGILDEGGFTSMAAITLSSNIATGSGGGMLKESGQLDIRASTVDGNVSHVQGGGIVVRDGETRLTNSTISANQATGQGGGIAQITGTLTIASSTLALNTGASGGDAIHHGAGIMTLRNTIVYNTGTQPDCTGAAAFMSGGYNLGYDISCQLTATGDRTGIDPLLGALQNNGGPTRTHALTSGSRAIDAGNPGGCRDAGNRVLANDQRGFSRHVDGDLNASALCDIGAFEFGAQPPPQTVTATATLTNPPPSATRTLPPSPTRTLVPSATTIPSPTVTQGVPPTRTPTPTPTPRPEPIPEPGTLLLFGGGAAALAAYLRRRRTAQRQDDTSHPNGA